MGFFNNIVYSAFTWLYTVLTHDYVLTIILATLVLKMLTLPMDIKQRQSSKQMASIQPELQRIQKKYANDPQKMQQKNAEAYKKHHINPYASCLPLLITMPLFIMFLGGFNLMANEISVKAAIEVSQGNLQYLDQFQWLWVNNVFRPDSGLSTVVMTAKEFETLLGKPLETLTMLSPEIKETAKTLLENYDTLVFDPANQYVLQKAPAFLKGMLGEGGVLSNGWFLLPILSGVTMLAQNMIMQKGSPTGSATPGMGKSMTYGFAVFSVFICATNTAMFGIYWITSNLAGLAVQLIFNKIYKPKEDEAVIEGEGTVK